MGKSGLRRARTAVVEPRGEMAERGPIESLTSAGYVEFVATGQDAAGEFHCAECGYGVAVQRRLPLCPMCGGTAWERPTWSTFVRRHGEPLQ
jgi:rubrerythrin